MTLSDLLYILFISPLESVMALVLEWARLHISELGFAILFLSLIVNIALLPIYYIAEKWQKEERLKQSKMSAKLAEIRQVFRGQERFAMISTLYRQNHYHPLMAVRSSFGLLIQIPFFFAAYHLLSHYEGLNGHSFGLISDLGQPDSLLQVGSVSIHLLPVLMTIISLGSAYLYADELTKSAKLQLYGLALIFLVVLYDSPSGLLVYWTFNNIFSLFKNLIHWFFKNRTLGWFTKLHEYVIKEREVSYFSVSLPFLKQASGQSRSLALPTSFLIHIGVALLLYSYYNKLFKVFELTGVNRLFTDMITPTLYRYGINTFIVGVLFHFFAKRKLKIVKAPLPKPSFRIFLVLLLPLSPAVQYVRLNTDLVNFKTGYEFLLFIILIGAIFIYFVPEIFYRWVDYRAILAVGLTFIFLVVAMPDISGYAYKRKLISEQNSIQLAIFTFLLIYIFSQIKKEPIRWISLFYFASTFLLGASVNEVKSANRVNFSDEYRKKLEIASTIEFQTTPNIYLLVYDAYPDLETLDLYGVNNFEQYNYLKRNNFMIYDGTYSIAIASIPAMSRVLSVDSNYGGLWFTSGKEGIATKILRKNGYHLTGNFASNYYISFDLGIEWDSYDQSLYNDANIMIPSVLFGTFHMAGLKYNMDGYFDRLRDEVLMNHKSEPQFMYSHFEMPGHSSLSGVCFPNEYDLFRDRLKLANETMRNDIEKILQNNKNSIIIVAGDHGPYLTKNCSATLDLFKINQIDRLDIQDRYGSFLAIRWPEAMKQIPETRIMILQDVLLEVFRALTHNKDRLEGFDVDTTTLDYNTLTGGVFVKDGIIHGGKNDGEPLFLKPNTNSLKSSSSQ